VEFQNEARCHRSHPFGFVSLSASADSDWLTEQRQLTCGYSASVGEKPSARSFAATEIGSENGFPGTPNSAFVRYDAHSDALRKPGARPLSTLEAGAFDR
jgi:hypothetical protein